MRVVICFLAACASSSPTVANHTTPALPPPVNPICIVRADLDNSGLRHTIRSYSDELAKCARYVTSEQRVQATFTIGNDGRVTSAEVGGAAHELDACVCNVVATFAFPPFGRHTKSVVVTYPFVFSAP